MVKFFRRLHIDKELLEVMLNLPSDFSILSAKVNEDCGLEILLQCPSKKYFAIEEHEEIPIVSLRAALLRGSATIKPLNELLEGGKTHCG